MTRNKPLSALLFVSMTFAILSFSGKEALAGGFIRSCSEISLDLAAPEILLRATCRRADGTFYSSFLVLDSNIGNVDGVLRINSRNFSDSCKIIGLGGDGRELFLFADCLSRAGVYIRSSIDLNRYISNRNGVLWFD